MAKEKNELYKLRGNILKFDNPKELKENALSFFDNYKFSLVSGYVWGDSVKDKYDGWKLDYISPNQEGDEITIRNFFEGLERVSKLDKICLENFKGYLFYDGVERRSSEFFNRQIFAIWFDNLNEHYSLNLEFSRNGEASGNSLSDLAYKVYAKKSGSRIREVMDNYLGPNKKTK